MDDIFGIVLFLLIGFILGLLGRRFPRAGIPESLADSLTTFVIFVSLPALILVKVPALRMSGGLLVPVVLPWVMLGLSVVMVLWSARVFSWDARVRNLLLLVVPLGNTSFLGIPMVQAFFGESQVAYALIYDQLGSFLALATYGTFIVSLRDPAEAGATPSAREILLRVATFPPFIALVAAIAIGFIGLPGVMYAALGILSNTLVPVVMVAVGLRLRVAIPSPHRGPLAAGLAMKMILAPLLALACIRAIGLEGDAVDVSVFETGMPPMVAAWALAARSGLLPELVASMVGLGIVLSFATLPLLALLIRIAG